MNKEIALNNWPITNMGGPLFHGTQDAIIYATLSYNNDKFISLLKPQLDRLIAAYESFKGQEPQNVDLLSDFAFDIQFCKEAMREIVKLRYIRGRGNITGNRFDDLCPFCCFLLIRHSDFGDCPEDD